MDCKSFASFARLAAAILCVFALSGRVSAATISLSVPAGVTNELAQVLPTTPASEADEKAFAARPEVLLESSGKGFR